MVIIQNQRTFENGKKTIEIKIAWMTSIFVSDNRIRDIMFVKTSARWNLYLHPKQIGTSKSVPAETTATVMNKHWPYTNVVVLNLHVCKKYETKYKN